MEDKPYAFSVGDYDNTYVYPSIQKAIQAYKDSCPPQQLNITAHYSDGQEVGLGLEHFLLHGFAVEKNVDGEMVAKIVDKQIAEREKWMANFKPGTVITGSSNLFGPANRDEWIKNETARHKFDWNNEIF